MATTDTERTRARRPRTAFWLSALGTGLGHIYCGAFAKGFVLFFAGTLLGAVGALVILPVWGGLQIAFAAALIVSVALWVYAMVDAPRLARKTPPDYVLRDYNRWYVYLALVLLGLPPVLGLALHVRATMVHPMRMATGNMRPTIQPDERFLVNKMAYRHESPRRGDIVVLRNPDRRHVSLVRRVVALAGDTVEIRGGRLLVGGRELPRSKASAENGGGGPAEREAFEERNGSARYSILLGGRRGLLFVPSETRPAAADYPQSVVPKGHCFVLGDDRGLTEDSRTFGPVSLGDVVGRVDYVYLPPWRSVGPARD
jgi:signal peptidase I